MSEWWTYGISDFLLYSPRTYYRLFELYHRDLWPMQIVAVALGVVVLVALRRPGLATGRAISAILAGAWLWVAWAFHYERYATINWAATYFAAAFVGQALLLLWTGVIRARLAFTRPWNRARRIGGGLAVFAIVVEPVLGVLAGRTWPQWELFWMTPDPTVVATLAVVVASDGRQRHLLLIPIAWCLISALFAWAMHSPEAYGMLLAVGVTLLVEGLKGRGVKVREPRLDG